jgi:hypothetical protein
MRLPQNFSFWGDKLCLSGPPEFPVPSNMNPAKKTAFFRVFFVFFTAALLGAGESRDLILADRCYDNDDYGRAYELYQQVILRQDPDGISGDTLYRYGYSYERTRGLDNIAVKIYALSVYYNKKAGRADSKYALYAGAKLADDPARELDDRAAAAVLEELRDSINKERKTHYYRWVDRIYVFLSRFSVFQWKIIASLAALVPFFTGVLVFGFRERKIRP